jgi:hypothetical protein
MWPAKKANRLVCLLSLLTHSVCESDPNTLIVAIEALVDLADEVVSSADVLKHLLAESGS